MPERIQRICAYGIHVLDDTILLVRASDLTEVAGRWFLPGGGVDFAEHPVDALRREVTEETGLSAEIGDQIGVVSDVRTRRNGTTVHSVRMIYRIEHVAGDLAHETSGSSDLAAFVTLDDARRLTLAHYVLEAGDLLGLNLRRGTQVPS